MTKQQIRIWEALNSDEKVALTGKDVIEVAYVEFDKFSFKEKDGSMKSYDGAFIVDSDGKCYRTSAKIVLRQLRDLVAINGSPLFDDRNQPTITMGVGGEEGQYLKIDSIK